MHLRVHTHAALAVCPACAPSCECRRERGDGASDKLLRCRVAQVHADDIALEGDAKMRDGDLSSSSSDEEVFDSVSAECSVVLRWWAASRGTRAATCQSYNTNDETGCCF